jgi:hypothetical protein
MLDRCQMQFCYRRVENLIIPPAVAMVIGTGTHRAVEANMRHKITSGGAMEARDRLDDVAAATIKEEFRKGVKVEDDDGPGPLVDIRDAAIKTAQDLHGLHYDQLAPRLEPIHVERKWVLELEGYPMNLAGSIDLEEKTRIRDTKTSKRTKNQDEADSSSQLTMYALARKVLDGALPQELTLDNLVALKTPKLVVLTTTRDEQDVTILLRRIERAIEVINKGAFMPCDPTNWVCSPKWCGYFQRCPFSRKPVTVPAKGV